MEDCSVGTTFLGSLTQFANYFLSGKAPTQLCPWFCGATLTALQKKDGVVRPISVGETLLRLIRSCAVNKESPATIKFFQPLQLGIATKNGTKSVVHAVRRV